MKIAIDCRFIGKSGIGTYIENVLDEFLNNHPEHEYLLIVETKNKLIIENKCAQFLKTDIKPFSLKELLFFPVREINRCDAFFSPYVNIPGGIRIPVFSSIHDVVFYDVDGLVSPIGKLTRKFFFKRAICKSNLLFTVSEFSKERILHHFPTKKEFVVVYNGISKAVKDFDISYTNKKDYFLYVGNIKKHKGLKTLIEAYRMAQMKGLQSKLVIVGSKDKLRTADTEIVDIIAQTDNVEFTGWVPDDKLAELVAEAKILVQPSLYEGFGIPPLEALYLGTNVILSDIPVFKEIYKDFPVTYFKVGDSKNLCEKLMELHEGSIPLSKVKEKIDSQYSYAIVANSILFAIERDVKQITS